MIAQTFYTGYEYLFNLEPNQRDNIGTARVPLPTFTVDQYKELFYHSALSLKQLNTLLDIESPCVVIGDLHGNIKDLFRIIWENGHPYCTKYVFLGDYVDRGDFSLEVISLLLALQIILPHNFYLIRGNHEDIIQNKQYGFLNQINRLFPDSNLLEEIDQVYSYLPLAALIDKKYFCVHAGISPGLTLKQLYKLQRPIKITNGKDKNNILVNDLLWSDFDSKLPGYMNSFRGVGKRFGPIALNEFIKKNDIQFVIRGHQFEGAGVVKKYAIFTVFSSSNYCAQTNEAGYLVIDPNNGITSIILPMKNQVVRDNASFVHQMNPQKLSDLKTGFVKVAYITNHVRRTSSLAHKTGTIQIPRFSSSRVQRAPTFQCPPATF